MYNMTDDLKVLVFTDLRYAFCFLKFTVSSIAKRSITWS